MSDEEIEATIKELEVCADKDTVNAIQKLLDFVQVLFEERNKYRFLLEREQRRVAELLRDN